MKPKEIRRHFGLKLLVPLRQPLATNYSFLLSLLPYSSPWLSTQRWATTRPQSSLHHIPRELSSCMAGLMLLLLTSLLLIALETAPTFRTINCQMAAKLFGFCRHGACYLRRRSASVVRTCISRPIEAPGKPNGGGKGHGDKTMDARRAITSIRLTLKARHWKRCQ